MELLGYLAALLLGLGVILIALILMLYKAAKVDSVGLLGYVSLGTALFLGGMGIMSQKFLVQQYPGISDDPWYSIGVYFGLVIGSVVTTAIASFIYPAEN